MQIFKFWGYRGKFQFLLTKPYKECEGHRQMTFQWHFPLKAIIAVTTVLPYHTDCDNNDNDDNNNNNNNNYRQR